MKTHQRDHRKWLLGAVCLWLSGGGAFSADKSASVGEYQVKAAFIYNFTQFTDWPPGAFSATNAPIVIGIVGEDPFGDTMDEVVRGEVVRGRPLVVKRLRPDEDLRSCHVVFISRAEKDRLPALLSQLKGSPILTVSDAGGFAEQGGMVNLLLVQKTIKLEINPAAAADAGLQISAKLLKLARIVKSK